MLALSYDLIMARTAKTPGWNVCSFFWPMAIKRLWDSAGKGNLDKQNEANVKSDIIYFDDIQLCNCCTVAQPQGLVLLPPRASGICPLPSHPCCGHRIRKRTAWPSCKVESASRKQTENILLWVIKKCAQHHAMSNIGTACKITKKLLLSYNPGTQRAVKWLMTSFTVGFRPTRNAETSIRWKGIFCWPTRSAYLSTKLWLWHIMT